MHDGCVQETRNDEHLARQLHAEFNSMTADDARLVCQLAEQQTQSDFIDAREDELLWVFRKKT